MVLIEQISSRIDLMVVAILVLVALVVLIVDLIYLALTEPQKRRNLKRLREGKKDLVDSPILGG